MNSLDVAVAEISREQATTVQNLVQLYTHDFSEYWPDSAKGELQADGRFAAYDLERYWNGAGWSASLIHCNESLAGFVLVNNQARTGQRVDFNMAEFFIARKYRARGVGRRAAEIVFARHEGTWEVAVARKNVAALSFWRKIVGGAPHATQLQEIDVSNEQWNGAILRFDWRATAN